MDTDGRGSNSRAYVGRLSARRSRSSATTAIPAERRTELERLRDRTNPRRLRQEIQDGLAQLLALPCADMGSVENVLETLHTPMAL